ncbi:MAG: EAL domain-containing protein [Gammaproteobacteria bacterium]|nr:EAL domain-containing protein [Gammaproteobacteria bacterium]
MMNTSSLPENAKKAVIIDDFVEMAEFLRDLCAASGYVAKLYERTADVDPAVFLNADVLFLDLSLPETDGVQFMRQLGGLRCQTPIILISGHASCILSAAVSAGRESGLNVIGGLRKPFSIADYDALMTTLESAADQAASPLVTPEMMQEALDNNRIEPYFQPKIDLRRLEVCGFEALARLRLPDGRIVLPDQFIPTASECGLGNALTDRMLILSLDAWRDWAARGSDWSLAVNIPISRLADVQFPDRLEELADLWGIDRRQLILEITETELLDHHPTAMDTLARLGMKRFSLAVDDFGTGFSSLMQLKRLPCVELKIDRSFVSDMHRDRHSEVIVRKSIEIGHELGLIVTAEGIESQDDVDALRAMGCDQGQGYFISRPESRQQIATSYIDGFAA